MMFVVDNDACVHVMLLLLLSSFSGLYVSKKKKIRRQIFVLRLLESTCFAMSAKTCQGNFD
jgi:heme O synthase-like polyprenyltransferase